MVSCSNPFLNRTFHNVFYSVLYILTSPLLQLLLYQVIKFQSVWYKQGLFHLLILLYFPCLIIALLMVILQVYQNFDSYSRSPFFLEFGQLFCLGVLTGFQIVCDFLALTINTTVDIQQ